MKNFDEHIDLIERYLYDDLTQEELEEFNGLLQKDSEFNKLFYEMDNLLEGIRRSAKQTTVEEKLARLEHALSIEDTTPDKEEETPVVSIWRTVSRYAAVDGAAFTAAISAISGQKYRMAIAAGFTILVTASILLFNTINSNSPASLFSDNFVPFENQGNQAMRGGQEKGANQDMQLLREALLNYDNGNYQNAVEIFERIDVNDGNKFQVWMYGGNTYLQVGQVDKAKQMFQNIIDENAGVVIQAKWYLSLCYIKNGEYEMARPLLEEIKDLGKYKNEEASKILSKI